MNKPSPTEAQVNWWTKLRLERFILFALVITVAGLSWVTTKNSRNVDDIEKIVNEVQPDVQHINEFVETLEQPQSEEERAQNEAISRAVQMVPQIKAILCEEFPEADECLGG